MSSEQRTLCCSVSVAVTVMCSVEMTIIIVAYLTNVEHPLMRCRSYNVSTPEAQSTSFASQHRLCTTNRALLAWLIAHLFINLVALVAVQTTRHRALLPYIYSNILDLLIALAYLVVLFVQLIRAEEIDQGYRCLSLNQQYLAVVLFIVTIVIFKAYSVFCSRRLYWILQSLYHQRYSTRTLIVKDESEFQL